MKVMLSAGEASGDMHGAELIAELRRLRPNASFLGMGGALMQAEGMQVLFDPTGIGAFGLVEVVRLVPLARRVRALMVKAIETERPDVLVLIDYPGFNMRLAREAKARNIKCVYYFCPSAWAWGRGRASKVANTVTKVASVFPFEEAVYREAGADVVFVGHPLKDMVRRELSDEQMRAEHHIPMGSPVVALCPGSRRREVTGLYPAMLEAAKLVLAKVPDVTFICPVAPTVDRAALLGVSQEHGVEVRYHEGCIYDVYGASDMAVIASGTATLEAALAGTPMVVVYRVAPLTYQVFRRLIKTPHISLPNIVAGRAVVSELLQGEASPPRIATELIDMLEHPKRVENMRRELANISEKLGPPGAVSRVAQLVVAVGEGVG